MDIILDFAGYTNETVVYCLWDKSPLEFYARVANRVTLEKQLEILNFTWPGLTENDFVEHVCSSSLEKRAWMNRKQLLFKHNLKITIRNVTLTDLAGVLKRSLIDVSDTSDVNQFRAVFGSRRYPTLDFDFVPLIKARCDPYFGGMTRNTLYYLTKPPVLVSK